MLYQEYQKWLGRNCPPSLTAEDFQEFCALIGAMSIQKTITESQLTIDELIERLFDKPRSLN
jgi:hypothetical protein